MGLLDSVLKIFVGDKAKKDIKDLQPYVNQILSFEKELSSLSIDELRAKTQEFKDKIQAAKKDTLEQIENLKLQVEQEQDIDKKEDLYNEIDQLNDVAYDQTEAVLEEIMAEAFAVVKETATFCSK
ncbi:protein export cytoplasm protein SecA ATPase RNA helicase [Nonlabens tegetincola]|uniref:Protein export cytoplasm protein SecA ATPase RNA helicase n=1 Tax=Nonlabens tegetincola TaxID=323273 RepID=A0A090Q6T6_9FLAO|nr:protein export cytoplasm protein SecA ATPase RNA helicase [Nonlabens tegetincola]